MLISACPIWLLYISLPSDSNVNQNMGGAGVSNQNQNAGAGAYPNLNQNQISGGVMNQDKNQKQNPNQNMPNHNWGYTGFKGRGDKILFDVFGRQ